MEIKLPVIHPGLEIGSINLTTKKVKINSSNLIDFQCKSRVDCCSTMEIPVTEYDITKIETHGYELDQIIKSSSPIILGSKLRRNQVQKAFILKTKPFDNTCTFLEENLCKIHEFKPFACKIYPFSLDISNEKKISLNIHHSRVCKSIKKIKQESSKNREILKDILAIILQELKERGYKD